MERVDVDLPRNLFQIINVYGSGIRGGEGRSERGEEGRRGEESRGEKGEEGIEG